MIVMLHFLADGADQALAFAISINANERHFLAFVDATHFAGKVIDFSLFDEIRFHVSISNK